MFKRIIWMGTGAVVGASGAFWAKRKVEATVAQYLPDQVAERAAVSARDLGRTVRAAAAEGRVAMKATEAELRAKVEERTFVGAAKDATPVPAAAAPSGRRRATRAPTPQAGPTVARRRSRR